MWLILNDFIAIAFNYCFAETILLVLTKWSKANTNTQTNTQRELVNHMLNTEELAQAYALMQHTQNCVFLTGKAGTGKSTLMRYFIGNTDKNVAVLAPTGIAAINIGGVTIHSFFRFPFQPVTPDQIKLATREKREVYEKLDTIIIDEISMVRVDILDAIDYSLRLNRKNPAPFGGVQMIFVGDLAQLPPVVKSGEEKRYLDSLYRSPFFIDAAVFSEIELNVIELSNVFRQDSQAFVNLLNNIRSNTVSMSDIDYLNSRFIPNFEPPESEFYITLTTTNAVASAINDTALDALETDLFCYQCQAIGSFENTQDTPAERKLYLKEGAQVMFVKNDESKRWVNGTVGKVIKLDDDRVVVELENGVTHVVEPAKWEILSYRFDDKKGKLTTDVIGAFIQYPLRLAWAITIHKSQGKTFERVCIDLGNGAFAHGQLYVALSRCRTLEGLILNQPVKISDVIVDRRFLNTLAA